MAAMLFALPGLASAAITGTSNSANVAGAIAVDPPTGSAFSLNYPGPRFPDGFSDTPLTGFPTAGDTFGILTTGDVAFADDPNNSNSTGFNLGTNSYGEAFDPTTLRIDLNVPAGNNCVAFDFRFLSEEYPEFVNAGFNDAFIAQLDQLAVQVTGSTIIAPGNFAAGAGDQISVDDQGPSGMTAEAAAGTTYDGATDKLVARAPANPGSHTVYLTIFDAGDHIYDSAAFVDNLRFENAPPGQCKSLAAEPFEGTTGVTLPDGSKVILCEGYECTQFNLTCNLPGGAPIGCSPFIAVMVNFNTGTVGKSRRATSPLTIGSTQADIPAAATQLVSVPTSEEGKAAMAKAAKQPKKLKKKAKKAKKQAKKLQKKAKKASGAEAKKLKKKAKKLQKKAKKLKKKAKKAKTLDGTIQITNPANGAVDNVPITLNLGG